MANHLGRSNDVPGHRPAHGIHLAADGEYVVILDERADRYTVANQELSAALLWALSERNRPERPHTKRLAAALVERGILEPANDAAFRIPRPREPGGLSDRRWTPLGGAAIAEKSQVPVTMVARATARLRRGYRLARAGTASLLPYLRGVAANTRPEVDGSPRTLVEAHIRARMIYPRRTACLAGAAALADHAWRRGLPATFVIGVQTTPFLAHAWVELNGTPISDTPEVNRVLAPIVTLPPGGDTPPPGNDE